MGGGYRRVSFEPEFTQMPLAFSSRDNAVRTVATARLAGADTFSTVLGVIDA